MSSSNKTTNLQLNQWITSDYVKMDDFNSDNFKLDAFAGRTITTDKLINNASATETGFALDARMGKTFGDQINTINNTVGTHTTEISNITTSLSDRSNPNLLINGDFQVWQRGTSFTIGNVYTADRWYLGNNNTVAQSTDVPNALSSYSAKITVGSVGSAYFMQKSERRYAGQKLTVSFYAKGAQASQIPLYSGNQQIGTLNITTSWQKFTITFIDDGVGDNLIKFGFSINGNIYYLSQCKIELGSIATLFVPRPYAEELALCQRYYIPNAVGFITDIAANTLTYFVPLPTTLRAIPIIGSATTWLNAGGQLTGFSYSCSSNLANGIVITATKTSHGVTGDSHINVSGLDSDIY